MHDVITYSSKRHSLECRRRLDVCLNSISLQRYFKLQTDAGCRSL